MKKDSCKLDGTFDVLVVMTPILLIAIPLIIREIMLIVG